jgi:hypothetical protein
MKPGDRVRAPSGRTGTIKRLVEEDAEGKREWPLPYAWVEMDDDDLVDIELKHLTPLTSPSGSDE